MFWPVVAGIDLSNTLDATGAIECEIRVLEMTITRSAGRNYFCKGL
jgi:hypothetical protein